MENCCICDKKLGILAKWSKKEFPGFENDPRVHAMSDEDRVCTDCMVAIKNQEKDEKKSELKGRFEEINKRTAEYKEHWDKNGVVQFKNERIAILKRAVGAQVQFIIAYDDLTKEGYRLMAIDEGKEIAGGGITGGSSAYFYFQKIDYVTSKNTIA